jgi:hypothetical protein
VNDQRGFRRDEYRECKAETGETRSNGREHGEHPDAKCVGL